MIRKKIRNFRTFSSRKHQIKSTFRKKSIEKMILINFQPFQKQIKVLTKFHNFKLLKMKKKIGRRRPPPTPPLTPPDLPSDPPKRPQVDPKARLCFGFPTPEAPVLRFSDSRSTFASVLSPCVWTFSP